MRISSKRQISTPKNVMESLNLHPGDEVEFKVEDDTARLIPVKTIKVPRDQAWFWTQEWQAKEKQAEQNLFEGHSRDFDKLDDLLKELYSED